MLKVEMQELGGTKRELKVEVPVERADEELEKAYQKYRKAIQIPGFRRGRIPLSLIRSRFGESIKAEVLNELLPNLYEEAREAAGVETIAPGEIEEVDYEEGDHLRFTVVLEVKPDFQIDRYTNLKVEKPIYPVVEEDLERRLEALRTQHAVERTVDRPSQAGDFLTADIQRLDRTGVPIVGQRAADRSLEIGGEESPGEDFERQLIGLRPGEERHIRFSYREDWPDQRLAGREEALAVTVKEIKEREVPELDDEFAKDVGSYETLDQLQDAIRENLARESEFVSRRALETNVVEQVARENAFEPPEVMVENTLGAMLERAQTYSPEPVDEVLFREQRRDDAVRQVRDYLILDEVASREEIEITEEEIDARIAERAELEGRPVEQVKEDMAEAGRIDDVRLALLHERVLTFLIDNAEIIEVEVARDADPQIVQADAIEE